MRIRANDMVVVLSGDNASKTPKKVLTIVDGGTHVVVEGVNRVYKHVKKGHPKSPQGGRLSKEMPIDASKVMLLDPANGQPTRVGVRYLDDGSKELYAKKSGTAIRALSKPRPAYAKTRGLVSSK